MFKKSIAPAFVALLICLIGGQALAAPTSSLHGTVVNAQDHSPIANVTVDVYAAPSTQSLATATTDKNGSFVVVGLPPGTYQIKLAHPTYETIMLTGVKVNGANYMQLKGALAMQPAAGTDNRVARQSACTNILQPGQTADVYIVCSDRP
jgi:hypothetical protein